MGRACPGCYRVWMRLVFPSRREPPSWAVAELARRETAGWHCGTHRPDRVPPSEWGSPTVADSPSHDEWAGHIGNYLWSGLPSDLDKALACPLPDGGEQRRVLWPHLGADLPPRRPDPLLLATRRLALATMLLCVVWVLLGGWLALVYAVAAVCMLKRRGWRL